MKKIFFYYLICAFLLISCSSNRNLVYFSNLDKASIDNALNKRDIKIQPDDLLSISINSLSDESNALFSKGGKNAGIDGLKGYKVSKDGKVNIISLGETKVEGLTIEQAEQAITQKALLFVKDPVVDVSVLNFKITVIGEVNKPATFTIQDENVNLLEALGMAGDMTPYGKRENVLIIREEDGKRISARVNLNDKEVMNSPYFSLKQNDVVYVEPHKSKAIEYSASRSNLPMIISAASVVAILLDNIINR
jgi:polysaccharide export outer membrane protein